MKNKGIIPIAIGLLLITAALCLTGYNLYDDYRAGKASGNALEYIVSNTAKKEKTDEDETPLSETEIPDYQLDPQMEMPAVSYNGDDYVGYLDMPTLGMSFPVMKTWDYEKMKNSPCVFSGSAYTDNLVVCAHNYTTHFGPIDRLRIGDVVTFTDTDGNVFGYTVEEIEILEPTAVKEMTDSGYSLTLFTCTMSGTTRIAVRCTAAVVR